MREELFLRSGGRCEQCQQQIEIETFHAAHLRAHSNGGAAVFENLGAWCARCNLSAGAVDAADTRVQPRDWQWRALERVVERIRRSQVATVAAAPGAGKTVLAALTFEALRASGQVERMVVFAPRRTLVQQWHDSALRTRHAELHPGSEVERRGQDGVVVTYQSLNPGTVGVHAKQADLQHTLFVLDEVHHVGEPTEAGVRPAWARQVTELIGDVERQDTRSAGRRLAATRRHWYWASAHRTSLSPIGVVRSESTPIAKVLAREPPSAPGNTPEAGAPELLALAA